VDEVKTVSAQFGKCNLDRKPVNPLDFDEVRPVLSPYGPDSEGFICKENLGILYRAFHTTKESQREMQPYLSRSGLVVTWDGRLDNREDLIGQLRREIGHESTDAEIVATAVERWGVGAFPKLIGDWALCIWQPKDQSLILAKDFLGARHLFYCVEKDQVTWCTILDPLVLFSGHAFELEEEYIAGWLALFPAPHLTPYVGIRAVPPSSFIRFASGTQSIVKYWDFDPGSRISYCTDAEYEEHFRAVFSHSVRRRLRSDRLVLAELSGGMDSSSIVCVADDIIAERQVEIVGLNTVSYYDDSEPNWNERPYFAKIEERRGRVGCHIDTGSKVPLQFKFAKECFAATPSSGEQKSDTRKTFDTLIDSHSIRVLLSGIGGDEVTGGVPTPTPELADLIAKADVRTLARQLKFWALHKRMPWFFLLYEVIRRFFPPLLARKSEQSPCWLEQGFVERHRAALLGYERKLTLNGPAPSFQENLSTLEVLRRQVGCFALPIGPTYETRYPFLDRDLLAFLFAVPRQQLVRPGQRRSLMRRALAGTVPKAILDRRRKAFVVRAPTIAASMLSINQAATGMICAQFGIVDDRSLGKSLDLVREGYEVPIVPLARGLLIESWLRHAVARGVLKAPFSGDKGEGLCSSGPQSLMATDERRFNPIG
jgi:asparagine synthase (glutamine-hydrolysing)